MWIYLILGVVIFFVFLKVWNAPPVRATRKAAKYGWKAFTIIDESGSEYIEYRKLGHHPGYKATALRKNDFVAIINDETGELSVLEPNKAGPFLDAEGLEFYLSAKYNPESYEAKVVSESLEQVGAKVTFDEPYKSALDELEKFTNLTMVPITGKELDSLANRHAMSAYHFGATDAAAKINGLVEKDECLTLAARFLQNVMGVSDDYELTEHLQSMMAVSTLPIGRKYYDAGFEAYFSYDDSRLSGATWNENFRLSNMLRNDELKSEDFM